MYSLKTSKRSSGGYDIDVLIIRSGLAFNYYYYYWDGLVAADICVILFACTLIRRVPAHHFPIKLERLLEVLGCEARLLDEVCP